MTYRDKCDLCPNSYFADLTGRREWDGTSPCPCGERHFVCISCTTRLDLLDDSEWGEGKVPLKTCPFSDEFRVGLALLDDGAVVEPQPRRER